ncbi:phage integrase SAM-like domain-containing protein [Chishuiella sp.]|uniref:phage integrase SAM-like domain-containing protein n=1 Tax=Chishuiella sp. TaxID=1969467 RepID=UPI0028AD8D64|nr:phage integrase SAM-like domain-containing protein [Chishuiella sp.]
MIKAEIILDTRRKTKKGYPAKIRVYDTSTKKHEYVSLKMYQEGPKLKSDNFIKQREYNLLKELEFVNSRSFSLKDSLDVVSNGIPVTDIEKRIIELEAELSKLKSQLNPTMLFEFSEQYFNEKKLRKESLLLHEAVLNKFKLFISPQQDIAINDLSFELLNKFQAYLIESISDSSCRTYFDKFSNIFREAQRREHLNIKSKNPFDNIKYAAIINDEDKSLSIDVMKKLISITDEEFSKMIYGKERQRAIALFLFQFAIGGHDLIDLSKLKWSNIKNGRISFRRYKNRRKTNGGALIDNKLFDYPLYVIEKYGTKDKEKVFDFIPEPDYETNNFKYRAFFLIYNNCLTKIEKHFKFSEKLRSKRTRYTFNTIAGNLLINRDIIEELQGHSQSTISHGYYGGTANEIKDREHKKIIDTVFDV